MIKSIYSIILLTFVSLIFSNSQVTKEESLDEILDKLGQNIYRISEVNENINNDIEKELNKTNAQLKDIFQKTKIDNKNKDNIKAFFKAAASGNQKTLELFFNSGFNVNVQNSKKQTAAMHAAFHGNIETLQALVDNGADLNIKDETNATPGTALDLCDFMPSGKVTNIMMFVPMYVVASSRYKGKSKFYAFEKCKEIIKKSLTKPWYKFW